MSELRPASVMQRKKIAQRNWPTLMLRNKIGILGVGSMTGGCRASLTMSIAYCHMTLPDECESCVCRTILLENTNDLFLTLSLLKLYRENCGEYQQPTQEAGGWGVRRWRIEGGGFSIQVITISWTHKCIPNRAYYLTTLLKKGVTVPSLTAPCDLLMYVAYVRKSPKPAPREHRWKFIQSWTYTHMHTYVYFLASETVNQIWGYLLHWKLNW